jgi:hypothetical protein
VIGTEAGGGLAFFLGFLGSLLPELLLHTRKGITLSKCLLNGSKGILDGNQALTKTS